MSQQENVGVCPCSGLLKYVTYNSYDNLLTYRKSVTNYDSNNCYQLTFYGQIALIPDWSEPHAYGWLLRSLCCSFKKSKLGYL